jgi:hypothetical protein
MIETQKKTTRRRLADTAGSQELRYLNEFQVAAMLGVSVRTVRSWRLLRKGPPWLKLGPAMRCAVRYDIRTLEEWALQAGGGQAA